MTPPLVAIDAIFNRPRDAAAILFLIEDSRYMAPLWQHLRDSYLPPLLNAIKVANPAAAVESLWMTASEHAPLRPQFDPSARRTPRWDDIPVINFSPHGGNMIHPANVACAIEALLATLGREPATRHLVIIAALNPSAEVLGPRSNLAWTTVVERLHQEGIWVHLIVRSQSTMDGLTSLYWDLIGKGHAHQSFADDTQFAFYLSDFDSGIDKGKASANDNRRVPNSGSQSTTSIGSSPSSIEKPSLVYQLQKMNGMEKKRRSRTRRDQPAANKPGQPYQKSHPPPRTNPSTTQPASPDLSGRSPSRRKDASRVDPSPSYFDPLPPRIQSDEQGSPYSLATSPPRSSSPSSPYHLSAGTSSSPEPRNLSPLRAALPILTPGLDHYQHMALTSQSTPDPLSPTSTAYHELQSYNQDLPRQLRVQHSASHPIPAGGSHVGTQFNDIYEPNRSYWNEYDRQQGQMSAFPRPFVPHPSDVLAPRLAHRPEQSNTVSPLPSMLHGLGTPPAGGTSGSYFYPDYEDRSTGASLQNTYLLSDRTSDTGSSSNVQYYS